MSNHPEVVELGAENHLARYWRVTAGKKGGDMVTVREGALATICLTCIYDPKCAHVRALEQYLAAERAA